MEGIRLTGALTFWKAPHPAWRPNPEWPEEVGFATWESTDVYVFIDPLVRDDLDAAAWQRFDRAVAQSDRPAAVLLTAPWHERSVRAVQRDTTRACGYTHVGVLASQTCSSSKRCRTASKCSCLREWMKGRSHSTLFRSKHSSSLNSFSVSTAGCKCCHLLEPGIALPLRRLSTNSGTSRSSAFWLLTDRPCWNAVRTRFALP